MQYYAHGKLLLSGEYLVLKGAEALAIPCKYGQSLSFNPHYKNLHWKSLDRENQLWLGATFTGQGHLAGSSFSDAGFLQKILSEACKIAGKPLPSGLVQTHLEFPQDWGLGSSSTLTSLIAQWLDIDPYELFFNTQNGSGYDIACATAKGPIVYTKGANGQTHRPVQLPEVFEEIYFVHLNQKQNSRPAVTNFLKNNTPQEAIEQISTLTQYMLAASTTRQLQQYMDEHENIMATLLQQTPVKQRLFSDFKGSIKSLGAWGGDFIMALGKDAPAYFKSKGYPTVLPYTHLVLP